MRNRPLYILLLVMIITISGCATSTTIISKIDDKNQEVQLNNTGNNQLNTIDKPKKDNVPNDITSPEIQDCTLDSECVPKECCHASTCILAQQKRPCNLMCTQECAAGTMDCGQGSCRCINNKCIAEIK